MIDISDPHKLRIEKFYKNVFETGWQNKYASDLYAGPESKCPTHFAESLEIIQRNLWTIVQSRSRGRATVDARFRKFDDALDFAFWIVMVDNYKLKSPYSTYRQCAEDAGLERGSFEAVKKIILAAMVSEGIPTDRIGFKDAWPRIFEPFGYRIQKSDTPSTVGERSDKLPWQIFHVDRAGEELIAEFRSATSLIQTAVWKMVEQPSFDA